jgi:hypothetical protein
VPINIQTLAHEVAEARRSPLEHAIHAHALPPDVFASRLATWRGGDALASDETRRVTWTAFTFAPTAVSVADTYHRVAASRLAGFYSHDTQSLFVRSGAGDGNRILPDSERDVYTLAHEIEHALQDQHFGSRAAEIEGNDAALAYRALIEGDAMLTEGAYRSLHEPFREHWSARMSKLLRDEGKEELLRRSGVDPRGLPGAPPLVARTVMFPYTDGLAFVADLYRAGGLPLVDRAFEQPPRSTEQILHTGRYLAGDAPVAVPDPVPPPGWTTLRSDTLGELEAGVLLGQCMQPSDGVRAATGWGGDRYAIARGPGGKLAVLWSTVWDDDAAAARFDAALHLRRDCLGLQKLEGGLGNDVVVAREVRRIAYVQGLGGADDQATARALLAIPIETSPAHPPFGPISVPPPVIAEEAFLGKGRFENGAWVSEPLGLRMELPLGFSPDEHSELEGPLQYFTAAHVRFTVLMTAMTRESDTLYLRDVLAKWREQVKAKRQSFDYVDSGAFEIGGVAGPSHVWRRTDGEMVRIAFVPVCGGKATLVLHAFFYDHTGWVGVSEYAKHLPLPAVESPLCVYLNSVRD